MLFKRIKIYMAVRLIIDWEMLKNENGAYD